MRSLVNSKQTAGCYNLKWNARDDQGNSVATGLYFVKMQAGSFVQVNKILFIK